MIPRAGTNEPSNASSTRSPKYHMTPRATRGAMIAAKTMRPIGAECRRSSGRRQQASFAAVDERELDEDPIAQFRAWLQEAESSSPRPDAMTLATATADGQPSARI